MKLWEQYESLGSPTGVLEFLAERIEQWPQYRLGKDRTGRPAILIEQPRGLVVGALPNVELRFISFWPATACEIGSGQQVDSGVFAIVRSKSDDPAAQKLFLGVVGSWIETLGQAPALSEVRSSFERLAGLFEALAEIRPSDAVGLWGELFMIAASASPELAVRAWHSDVRELFDFRSGLSAVEVKTTASKIRKHEFSLEQLSPAADTQLLVASMMLESSGHTVSLADLVNVVKAQLTQADLRLRVDELVASTLGAAWRESAAVRFSPASALSSLRFFRDSAIPCVERELPVEVSDVRFKVELDGVPPVDLETTTSISAFHKALAPVPRSVFESRVRL